jgi:hypothetical protein
MRHIRSTWALVWPRPSSTNSRPASDAFMA